MSIAEFDILKSRLRAYCNVNAFDLAALRTNLDRPDNAAFRDTFRTELAAVIAGRGLNRHEYEAITGESFDEDADFIAMMQATQAYLFEGGPMP
jgi:hypothetical protein